MPYRTKPRTKRPNVHDDRALDKLAEALDAYYGVAGDLARARAANTLARDVVFVPSMHRAKAARAIDRMVTSLERSLRAAEERVLKLAQEQRDVRE